MKPKNNAADDDLTMEALCRNLKMFKENRQKARRDLAGVRISINNMASLIFEHEKQIKELERKGIKRVEIKDEDMPQPQPVQMQPGGR